MKARASIWFASCLALFVASCGGKVLVEKPQGQKTPAEACKDLCDAALNSNCGEIPDCELGCTGIDLTIPDGCDEEYVALIECFIDTWESGNCDPLAPCETTFQAYSDCAVAGTGGSGG
ncbi:MAG: hypothetical protein IPK82_32545 [Polyangiaceae bacterium]|nr:hypothetical protein [Polyangiaceae bacterium]